jgi:uncharacterized protein (DUF58 family)
MPESPVKARFAQTAPEGREILREQAERAAAALPPLQVAAERLAATISLGVHGRRKAGMGETFWQFRRHRAEDPASAVDWRQSAKSQHLFVREREWEVAEAVWLWRDGSAGMRFASRPGLETKFARANLLTLALALLLVRGGERVALLGAGRPPASGRGVLGRIGHSLAAQKPDEAPLPPDAPMTRNAHFVWVSDFLSPADEIEAVMRRIARAGIHGTLIHIVDPAEEDFPFTGRTRFETPDGRMSETLGRAEAAQDRYRARFAAHCETIAATARRLGMSHMKHRTDHRPELALAALYSTLAGPRARSAYGRA